MKRANIEIAIKEAERFISAGKAALKRQDECWAIDAPRLSLTKRDIYTGWATKENGTCKRASLDLTRALAKLRQDI